MKPLYLAEIARAVRGRVVNEAGIKIDSVFSDSRDPVPGGLFVALKGENFDGHDFIESLENTGTAAVISETEKNVSMPQIIVNNTTKAFGDLASYYRSQLGIPIAALTGSVGKTTTKEMMHRVLSAKYNTLKTRENENNYIGVSQTLFRIGEAHEAAVVEMGTNNPGEINALSMLAKPDLAAITNIGVSHIERFGSRENILKEKLDILSGMKPGSKIVLNADDAFLNTVKPDNFTPFYFGIKNKSADIFAEDISEYGARLSFYLNFHGTRQKVIMPAIGVHNVYNALAAIMTGVLLGVSLSDAACSLARYENVGMRQRVREVSGIRVIEDCYNASPESVKAAMHLLVSRESGGKIAVLGDILELGAYSQTAHRLVGEYVAGAKADALFTYGEASKTAAKTASELGVKQVYSYTDPEELVKALTDFVKEGDTVLFKGSRGMKMENLIENFYLMLKG